MAHSIKKQKEPESRELLISRIREVLVPHFCNLGFEQFPLNRYHSEEELPIKPFRRFKGDILQYIEIPVIRSSFIIDCTEIPPEGVVIPSTLAGGEPSIRTQEEPVINLLMPNAYRLHSRIIPGIGPLWFHTGCFVWWDTLENRIKKVNKEVDRALQYSKEIELWFETKKVGKHMLHYGGQSFEEQMESREITTRYLEEKKRLEKSKNNK